MLHSLRDKLNLNVAGRQGASNGVERRLVLESLSPQHAATPTAAGDTFDGRTCCRNGILSIPSQSPEKDEILRYLEHCAERFDP